jgi:hypothetical protein
VEPHQNIRHTVQIKPHAISGLFQPWKWSSYARNFEWSTVCSTFSRSGWSVVRSASLAKGGTSKKRPSPHLHKVPIRSNKVSPRTFQMALVHTLFQLKTLYRVEWYGHDSEWIGEYFEIRDHCLFLDSNPA